MTADALVRARRRSVALAALLALASSAPAVAQTQLYLLTSAGEVEVAIPIPNPECGPWDYGCENTYIRVPVGGRVIQLDVDRRQIVATTPISRALGSVIGPRPTPDGRFLLWSGSSVAPLAPYEVSLFDIAHRQQTTPFAASGLSSVPLTVHPSEMRAFFQLSSGGPVIVAEPGHTHTLPTPPCAASRLERLSGDGSRLSHYCDVPRSVMVVDSGDGRLLGTVALGAPTYPSVSTVHVLDGPGTLVYAVDWDNAFDGDPALYRRFDVATGALLAERQGLKVRYLVVGVQRDDRPSVCRDLVRHRRARREHPRRDWPDCQPAPGAVCPKVALDPEQPHVYVAWPRDVAAATLRVSLVHTGTLATLASIDIPIDGDFVGMALGPRPPRVSDLSALVGGGLVTLSWATDASRSIATEQVVEVGFIPGQTLVRLPVAAERGRPRSRWRTAGALLRPHPDHERHGYRRPVERGDRRRPVNLRAQSPGRISACETAARGRSALLRRAHLRGVVVGPASFPIQNRGPGPARPARSPGLASRHCCRDRQPQPMHCVSPSLNRCSSPICWSTRLVQSAESLAQSARSGTRLWGSFDSSAPISSSDRPIL